MKIIIVGAGDVGFHIAEKLCGEKNVEVVIVEENPERMRQIEEHFDAQFVLGSGSSPDILKKAGVAKAGMVIAVSDQDEVNLVACMVANHYSKGSVKIARVRNPSFMNSPEIFAGMQFDLFINPEYEAAAKIARLLEVNQALDLIEFADGKILLAGFRVDANSRMANRKLFTLGELVPGYTPLVAAIYRGKEVIVPRGANRLRVGDIVYFTVTPDKMPKLLKAVGKQTHNVERVMIYGGTNTGFYLAEKLEAKGIDVKLIDPNENVCAKLADKLAKTTILHGEGMDGELLVQENIGKMDAFIAVSKDAEDNILSCLLAKSLGAKVTLTLSNRVDYTALVTSIGIDAAVSPQLAAVSKIMQFVRQGRVATVVAIREKNAEGIEFVAMESSEAVNTPLSKLKFPKGALVIAIVRGEEVIIPSGETEIEPEDRVILFVERSSTAKVEKLFAVKLEYF